MVISIDDELKDIKTYLEQRGYEIHNLSDNIPSDAYIYSENKNHLMSMDNSISPKEGGSIMINADGMDKQTIEYSLLHRVYTPLF